MEDTLNPSKVTFFPKKFDTFKALNDNDEKDIYFPTEKKNRNFKKIDRKAFDLMIFDEETLSKRIAEISEIGYFDPEKKIDYFLIFPNSLYLKIWEYFILFIVLYTIMIIPLEIGFFLKQKLSVSGEITKYIIFEIFIGFCFLSDLILNFRKAILNEQGDLITDPKEITSLYIKGFFLIDLLSSIPLEFFINTSHSIEANYLLLKIPRFFRTTKLFFFLAKFKNHPFLSIIRLLFIYFLMIHYFGCIISYTENQDNFEEFINNKYLSEEYPKYALLSILVLGGNNNPPANLVQRVIFIIMFYMGTILDIIVFGSITMLIKNFNHVLIMKKKKIDEVSLYLNSIEINEDLKNEISEYNEILWWKNRKKFFDESLMKDLNECLKVRLSILENRDKLYSVINFLDEFSISFFLRFTKKIKSNYYYVNDILIFEGDIEKKIYFIPTGGKVSVRINGNFVKKLTDGEFFGEISFFLKSSRRTATVTSLVTKNYFFIEEKDFTKMLFDFPYEAKFFYKHAFSSFKYSFDLMSFELKNTLGYYTKNKIYKSDFFTRLKSCDIFDQRIVKKVNETKKINKKQNDIDFENKSKKKNKVYNTELNILKSHKDVDNPEKNQNFLELISFKSKRKSDLNKIEENIIDLDIDHITEKNKRIKNSDLKEYNHPNEIRKNITEKYESDNKFINERKSDYKIKINLNNHHEDSKNDKMIEKKFKNNEMKNLKIKELKNSIWNEDLLILIENLK